MHNHFWRGPGWGGPRGGRRFKRGILKFVILKLLDEQSRHGYDLMRFLRRKGWAGGAGSIYPILAALEEEGLIVGRDEGDRRTYEVTDLGRRHLKERASHVGAFFEDGEEDGEPDARTETREAAGRLMQAVAQLGSDSKPETIERVRDLLDRTRKEIYTLLAQE